jgi:predicted MFS family arabinose efflux permease
MHPIVILIAGFLVVFVGGGARYAIGLTLKPMVAEFGWTRGELGLAVGVYFVVSAVATYIAGRIADRTSPRLLLNAGVVISAVGIGLMSLVSQPWHPVLFYGLIFAFGNGATSLVPVGVMVTRAFATRTGFVNAVIASGVSVGQLVIIAILAAVLASIGWRSVYLWLAVVQLALVPLLLLTLPARAVRQIATAPNDGMSVAGALRTRKLWLLLAIYAICGLDDFFVATHVVAFAQDRGVGALFAGNLLALMGLTALLGVLATGAISDRFGPIPTTAVSFAARVAVFGLIAIDQSTLSIAIFALVFGATFLMTAPLAVLFVRDNFGLKHLGALTGLITMVHQIFGGIGAYGGALIFDRAGSYDAAFVTMGLASALALGLTLMLTRNRQTLVPVAATNS